MFFLNFPTNNNNNDDVNDARVFKEVEIKKTIFVTPPNTNKTKGTLMEEAKCDKKIYLIYFFILCVCVW